MKVIDLLNKIANNEEAPKKIMYENKVYHYVDEYKDYEFDDGGYCLFSDEFEKHYGITAYLNDEVEILDETQEETPIFKKVDGEWYANKEMLEWLDKQCPSILNNKQDKIEKLNILNLYSCDDYQLIRSNFLGTWHKINEIIDYINKE